ncbi:MAG: 16S rRNA (adenine(1518)-N(6)/adenine(1519)-N(6))-dimethyltransferase RsmA [Candidatus Bilamarchaeaceae archaeon]
MSKGEKLFLKKRLGQYFLCNSAILEREVREANVQEKVVLEIGGGDGRLTEFIVKAGAKKIYVVEKDQRFVEILKNKFTNSKNVFVLAGDFLTIEIPKDVEVIIGNIPYYISSDIIFKLKNKNIEHAILMVQKEFAEKMVARPKTKNYGRLSVTSQIFFDVKLLFKVSAHQFTPPPKVSSTVISLKPKGIYLNEEEENLIRKIYQQKNKKLRNVLPGIDLIWAEKRGRELAPAEILRIVKAYSLNSSAS